MNTPQQDTFVSHLIELRSRLMKSVLMVIVAFIALSPWMSQIYEVLAEPLLAISPRGMIATGPIAPFFASMKATAAVAVVISFPVIIYQMWAFVAPGLYSHEKRLIFPLVLSTYILFLLGIAFAYFLVVPNVFRFIMNFTPEGVAMMPDMDSYLSFLFTIFFAFGIAFEVPVVVVVLARMGIITVEQLTTSRSYVIVGAFAIAAVITPPDVISQIMLAIPMIILYEIGVLCAKYMQKAHPVEVEEKAAPVETASDMMQISDDRSG